MSETASTTYPIRTVSELTGVNPVTLRAWERRYGLIKPMRTPKGHRIYSNDDIVLINEVCRRLNDGNSISRIASDLLKRDVDVPRDDSKVWETYCFDMLSAIQRFDESALDKVYNEANSIYPVDIVTSMLIVPLLELIGERWSNKTGTVAEEHFFSVYLRNKIGARFHHQNAQNRGHRLIAACLPGEHHEFGLLLFALSAHSRGYRIILLGADMPITELAHVSHNTSCNGMVLAGSANLDCSAVKHQLRDLVEQTDTRIFLGGDAVTRCDDLLADTPIMSIGSDITAGISIISSTLDAETGPSR